MRLEPIADRHVYIHENQLVGLPGLIELLLHQFKGLLTISRIVTFEPVLFEKIDNCSQAEKVILNNKHFNFG